VDLLEFVFAGAFVLAPVLFLWFGTVDPDIRTFRRDKARHLFRDGTISSDDLRKVEHYASARIAQLYWRALPPESTDVVHDVVTRILDGGRSLSPDNSFKSLRGAASSVIDQAVTSADHRRRGTVTNDTVFLAIRDPQTPETLLLAQEKSEAIRSIAKSIAREDPVRYLVWLAYQHGFQPRAIAKLLGIDPSDVNKHREAIVEHARQLLSTSGERPARRVNNSTATLRKRMEGMEGMDAMDIEKGRHLKKA